MAGIVVHYFDIYGRAEAIRLLLIHSRTPFVDHRLTSEEWPQMKASGVCEFGQLPMVEVDGLKLVQSYAIMRYLGVKLGYVPTDPVQHYQMDSIIGLRDDFANGLIPLSFAKDPEGVSKYYADKAPHFLKMFEDRLVRNNEGNGWFVGETATIADILMFRLLWDYFLRAERAMFAQYLDAVPKLKAHFDRMLASSPELKTYYETRPSRPY
jgi:glutathione S-transferase